MLSHFSHRLTLVAAGLALVVLAPLQAISASAAGPMRPSRGVAVQSPTVQYTLKTDTSNGMAFVGVGGDIDGLTNPTLTAAPGDVVKITMVNGDGVTHDLAIDEFGVSTGEVSTKGAQASVTFTVNQDGEYIYYCSIPGHRLAGMWGKLEVGAPVAAAPDAVSIVRDPTDVPDPIGRRAPQLVKVHLTAEEVVGLLADGTSYLYYTFDGKVPGPMLRARVGDTIELSLTNPSSSKMVHSIDLHAVTGPGGGSALLQVQPGDTKTITFKTLLPGLFVYHCATPSVAEHIANGMYGMILVEPAGGLPKVDKEFYVMQGDMYTNQPYGTKGMAEFDYQKMLDEQPEYFVFNGAAGALATDEHALRASVGDNIRIFFGVGGPNFTSSFHIIGEMFDKLYNYGSLETPPMAGVQTTLVPPGGAAMVELKLQVPGKYILVDHALSRLERGLVGYLYVEGPDAPDIYRQGPAE
jgi:nitrite reductase (NO-forming)